MYYKAFGYFPIQLDKGKYKIHLKYMTNMSSTFKPLSDWQVISFTLLDMN